MKKIMMAALCIAAIARVANADNCHYETRSRVVTKYETRYEQRLINDTWCGINGWGYYVCVPVTRWITVPVTVPVTKTEYYQELVCDPPAAAE